MSDDIVTQMKMRPDYSTLPVPDWSGEQMASGVSRGAKFLEEYFSPKKVVERGFYPALTDQGPEPKVPDRRTLGSMMRSGVDPLAGVQHDQPSVDPVSAMSPLGFARQLGKLKEGAKKLRNMKSITDDVFNRSIRNLDRLGKEAPPLATQRLKGLEVMPQVSEVKSGVGGRYWPKRVPPPGLKGPKIQVPKFGKRGYYTSLHEYGHHILETVYELTGEKVAKFSPKFRAMINEMISEDIPRRMEFHMYYDRFVEKLKSANRNGWLTDNEANGLATRFLDAYKRAIPHELFANTYYKALDEGLKGEEAVRVSLKAIINNREKMKKLSKSFSIYERQLTKHMDELVRRNKVLHAATLEGDTMQGMWELIQAQKSRKGGGK